MTEVQIISASWCKRCHTIRPEVAATCAVRGIVLEYVDYEAMDDDQKATIKSLPTIRMKISAEAAWVSYTADSLASWKEDFAISTTDTDF